MAEYHEMEDEKRVSPHDIIRATFPLRKSISSPLRGSVFSIMQKSIRSPVELADAVLKEFGITKELHKQYPQQCYLLFKVRSQSVDQ